MKYLTFNNACAAFIVSALAIALLSVLTQPAKADVDSRPIQVQETETSIKRNQVRITELKPLVEEFNTLKADNARLVGRLEVFGFAFDWSKLVANKVSEPSPL